MTLTKYLLFFATMNCAFAIYFIALYDAMHSNMMKYVLQNIVKRNLLLRKTHCKTSYIAMHCFVKRKSFFIYIQNTKLIILLYSFNLFSYWFLILHIGFSKILVSKCLMLGYQQVNLLYCNFVVSKKCRIW